MLADTRLFLREFRRTFHSTGAVLPSSPRLARALARHVASDGAEAVDADPSHRPRRILEVGPGTGAVTRQIVRGMRPTDELDLVELNDQFVDHLKKQFLADDELRAVGERSRILHLPVEEVVGEAEYDLIVSGLPLNNFSVNNVATILATFRRLLRPGGTLSFFEYVAVRPFRAAVSGREQKERLRGISHLLKELLDEHEIDRDTIWTNVPPAWVHHVRF